MTLERFPTSLPARCHLGTARVELDGASHIIRLCSHSERDSSRYEFDMETDVICFCFVVNTIIIIIHNFMAIKWYTYII